MELVQTHSIPYAPYMINRWLSFYDPEVALLVNEYANRMLDPIKHLWTVFSLLPPSILPNSMKRIKYVKKPKEDAIKEDEMLALLARSKEISKREAKMLTNNSTTDK